MTFRIKIATTPAELDGVFRVRHRVFVEEEGFMQPTHDGRICDRFDTFPTTANIVAMVGERVVGTIRFMDHCELGTSADGYFDFTPFQRPDGRTGSTSQYVVEREYRPHKGLSFSLMGMGYYWSTARGMTHLTAAANPLVVPMLEGIGWRRVAPEYRDHQRGLGVVPILLDLGALNDRFMSFVDRQGISHLLSAFDREFALAGNEIFRAGDRGDCMYVVVNGSVAIYAGARSQAEHEPLARLREGDLFGELALLIDRPRTATAIAETDVDLMVIDRKAFESQVRGHPDVAMNLLRMLGQRLADTTTRIAPPPFELPARQ